MNSSFAKLINKEEFELIYNINANQKIYFNELNLILPTDFNKENYSNLFDLLKSLKGKPYSILSIEKILEQIDIITLDQEFQSINATLEENIVDNKLNINFKIEEAEKYYLSRINILGNNIIKRKRY